MEKRGKRGHGRRERLKVTFTLTILVLRAVKVHAFLIVQLLRKCCTQSDRRGKQAVCVGVRTIKRRWML